MTIRFLIRPDRLYVGSSIGGGGVLPPLPLPIGWAAQNGGSGEPIWSNPWHAHLCADSDTYFIADINLDQIWKKVISKNSWTNVSGGNNAPVWGNPDGVVTDTEINFLYVMNDNDGLIYRKILSSDTWEIISGGLNGPNFGVDSISRDLAVGDDPNLLYVTVYTFSSIPKHELWVKNLLLDEWFNISGGVNAPTISDIERLTVSADGSIVYVIDGNDKSVWKKSISLDEWSVVDPIIGTWGNIQDVACSDDGGILWATDRDNKRISMLDISAGTNIDKSTDIGSPVWDYPSSISTFGNGSVIGVLDMSLDIFFTWKQSPYPVIIKNPLDQDVDETLDAYFNANASNYTDIVWQENDDGSGSYFYDIDGYPGGMTKRVSINNPLLSQDGFLYRCSFYNGSYVSYTDHAKLTVNEIDGVILTDNAGNQLTNNDKTYFITANPPSDDLKLFSFQVKFKTPISDFPFVISERDLPALFWDNVGDGSLIIVKDSLGVEVKRDLIFIDTIAKEFRLHVLINVNEISTVYDVFKTDPSTPPALIGDVFNSDYAAIIPMKTTNKEFITDVSPNRLVTNVGEFGVTATIDGAKFDRLSTSSGIDITFITPINNRYSVAAAKSSSSEQGALCGYTDGDGLMNRNGPDNLATWNPQDGWLNTNIIPSRVDWYTAAMWHESGVERKVWYNGLMVAISGSINDVTQATFAIGKSIHSATEGFDGKIKEVRSSSVEQSQDYIELEQINMMNVDDYTISPLDINSFSIVVAAISEYIDGVRVSSADGSFSNEEWTSESDTKDILYASGDSTGMGRYSKLYFISKNKSMWNDWININVRVFNDTDDVNYPAAWDSSSGRYVYTISDTSISDFFKANEGKTLNVEVSESVGTKDMIKPQK